MFFKTKMKTLRFVVVALSGLVLSIVGVGVAQNPAVAQIAPGPTASPTAVIVSPPNSPAGAGLRYLPRDLAHASPDTLGKAAIEYTNVRFRIVSGTPEVRVSRPVAASELPALGLTSVDRMLSKSVPLGLVVLKGDFDLTGGFPGYTSERNLRIQYIAYVIDLETGLPISWQTARTGGALRLALGDPSLPDEVRVWTPAPGAKAAERPRGTPVVPEFLPDGTRAVAPVRPVYPLNHP